MRIVDFRSDTLTVPTEEMREAMYEARVGDDVYGEDPTVKELEEMAAAKAGKESALFVTSGTMGNQLALLSHTKRGEEVILEENSHIYNAEVGGAAFLSGLQPRPIKGNRGIMDLEDIKRAIRPEDIHFPRTGLICIENTHNMAGGVVIPVYQMEKVYSLAREHNIPVHLDGARIFNAAIHIGCDVKELTQYCDSVMFCLSKGLCAPVGSILAGDKSFVDKAKRYRKMIGGGMRQAGVIAAPGIIALEKMVDRLEEDHKKAFGLAAGLSGIGGLTLDKERVDTNIVMVDVRNTGCKAHELTDVFREKGILAVAINERMIRFVTHKYISEEDVQYAVDTIRGVLS